MRAWAATAVVALGLVLAQPVAARTSSHATLVIKDMVFQPLQGSLIAGDVLTVVNADMLRHTATVKGEFDLDLKPGQSRSIVVNHPGTLEVVCRYHPTMTTHLIVKPSKALKSRAAKH